MNNTPSLSPEAIAALEQGDKIEAIKITRLKSGLDLKDSKDAVENFLKNNPTIEQRFKESVENSGGLGSLIWIVLALAALGAWWFFE